MQMIRAYLLELPREAAIATLVNLFFAPGAWFADGSTHALAKRLPPEALAPTAERIGMPRQSNPADMLSGYTLESDGLVFEVLIRDLDRGGWHLYFGVRQGDDVFLKLDSFYKYGRANPNS
ncbi:MAG: hypothetical protein QY323_04085 [Patescibacteria group bacterium]|nr:MAG: hypothetical protein QY323_04085 [Patescibacteria group bacterium]